MTKSIYVTTSIAYVNARPHVGFALELVQADVIARYHRLLNDVTRFQTGTDENAFKNVLSARAENISPQKLVDHNSQLFQELATSLNISHDNFIRTTSDQHCKAVQRFWQQLKKDDVYMKHYKGLYCVGCEDFYLERDLVDGCCPDHGTKPIEVEENNYFFRLSAYQKQIDRLIRSDEIKIIPETRKHEILRFVSGGLQDISISRPYDRSGGWGIQVPGDPNQVVYVWIDALINYIAGLGFGSKNDWENFWGIDTLKVHVIGKNVWKFHAVYWPALLLSAGLAIPDEILIHGFLTENGQKISKSKGGSIDPFGIVNQYSTDALRYYILRGVSPFGDSDFSIERLANLYNADLANGLGNLASRLATLCDKANYGKYDNRHVPSAPDGYNESIGCYKFDESIKSLSAIVTLLNQEIEKKRPWEALKEGNNSSLRVQLTEWLGELHRIAYWLKPFLPTSSDRILDMLKTDPIRIINPLFPRIR